MLGPAPDNGGGWAASWAMQVRLFARESTETYRNNVNFSRTIIARFFWCRILIRILLVLFSEFPTLRMHRSPSQSWDRYWFDGFDVGSVVLGENIWFSLLVDACWCCCSEISCRRVLYFLFPGSVFSLWYRSLTLFLLRRTLRVPSQFTDLFNCRPIIMYPLCEKPELSRYLMIFDIFGILSHFGWFTLIYDLSWICQCIPESQGYPTTNRAKESEGMLELGHFLAKCAGKKVLKQLDPIWWRLRTFFVVLLVKLYVKELCSLKMF